MLFFGGARPEETGAFKTKTETDRIDRNVINVHESASDFSEGSAFSAIRLQEGRKNDMVY